MLAFYFGLDELTGGWGRYTALYTLLEVTDRAKHPPTLKTLNRWRVDTPRGFAFVLHAAEGIENELLHLQDLQSSNLSPRLTELFTTTGARAHALAAKAVLLQTPPEFMPSKCTRSLMENIAHTFAKQNKAKLIWESSGLWEAEATRDFAESLGMISAIDPFLFNQEGTSFTHGDACFIVNEHPGARRRCDRYDFEEMLQWGHSYNRVFTLLRGQHKMLHAAELRRTVRAAIPEPE